MSQRRGAVGISIVPEDSNFFTLVSQFWIMFQVLRIFLVFETITFPNSDGCDAKKGPKLTK